MKLSPKREGPFTIKTKLSDLTYELNLPKRWKIHPVFHASLLTPFRQTEEHGPSFAEPPPDIIEGEEEYEVEEVLDLHRHHRKLQFLVKWKGYTDATWQPEADLENAQELVNEFYTKHPEAPK